jgi:hypothetical protein
MGYLLRSAAKSPDAALSERAALIVDRLELHALEALIPLLDEEERRLMAALVFAPARIERMKGLTARGRVALLSAAELEVVVRYLRGLDDATRRALVGALGPRSAEVATALGLGREPGQARGERGSGSSGSRILDALRLRRLFTR